MVRAIISAAGFEELPLFTRRRRQIPNEFGRRQRPKEAMDAAEENFRRLYGDVIRRRSWDSTYNCCGMVFANRRTSIEPADLAIVYNDEYRRLQRHAAAEGDVAVYRNERGQITHVGIVLQRRLITPLNEDDLIILSQWGFDGEYVHPSSIVPPQFGRLTEIWTERLDG